MENKKRRKIWISIVALLLVVAVVLAYFLIPKEPQKEVTVYSFDMVGYMNYVTGGNESYGVVATDRVQTVYLSDTQQVTEVKVYQGQQVKKGDVLYLYDTTLSDLELERKQLSIEQMELNLSTAKVELTTLKSMKPMVLRDQPDTGKTDNTKIPSNAREGVIYNPSGRGTQTNPYYVWIRSGTRITESMIDTYVAKANPVYVVFRVASRAGVAYTQEFGVRYWMEEKILEGTGGGITTASEDQAGVPAVAAQAGASEPAAKTVAQTEPTFKSAEPTFKLTMLASKATEPTSEPTESTTKATEPSTETTEPSTEPTKPSTETTEPSTEPTKPSTEPTEPSTEPTKPTEKPTEPTQPTEKPTESTKPTEKPTDPTESAPQKEKVLSMSFFTPGSYQQENAGDEIIWNSGYTSSELQTMRTEKEEEIEDLEFSIKMGKAEYEIMKKEADNGMVTADFDGVVTSVLEPDTAIAMDAPMIKVAGGGGFYVEGSVSELDLAEVQIGQKVTVTSWDTYMTYEGTIAEIGTYPTEDGNSYSYGSANVSFYPYKVFIEETADLQEGSYVSLVYQAEPEDAEEMMYLENAFLRMENGESFVYVQNEEGKLEKRVVEIGESTDGYSTPILSGLSMTDYIAFPYGNEVKEGAPTVEGTWSDLYGY